MQKCLYMIVGLMVGAGITGLVSSTSADAPRAFTQEDPIYRSLDASLYHQSSAEYRACCFQTYNLAALRLTQKTEGKQFDKPPAVILDLDETVFDNSGFQAMMSRSTLAYDQRLWDFWEESHPNDVTLVPGAKEFLAFAKEKKVNIVYITNRNEKYRTTCKAILEREGLSVPDEQLLLATKTSDKTERRAKVAEKFTVVMLVGDNLRDFDEVYRFDKEISKKPVTDAQTAILSRAKDVDTRRDKFGDEWIILPNCMYGEWQKPTGRGKQDLEFLRPTKK